MSQQADILVIDDSDLARASMARALSQAGFKVIDLPSPIGATSAILRSAVKLVVIDINMPSMRGDKLAALFRKSDRFRDLRIVLASGDDAEMLERLAREVNANAVVTKSAGNDELVRVVKELMEAA